MISEIISRAVIIMAMKKWPRTLRDTPLWRVSEAIAMPDSGGAVSASIIHSRTRTYSWLRKLLNRQLKTMMERPVRVSAIICSHCASSTCRLKNNVASGQTSRARPAMRYIMLVVVISRRCFFVPVGQDSGRRG